MRRFIRANTDKTVRAAYAEDNIEALLIHTVDDERFACDLATEMTEPPACGHWVRLSAVREDHPRDEANRLLEPRSMADTKCLAPLMRRFRELQDGSVIQEKSDITWHANNRIATGWRTQTILHLFVELNVTTGCFGANATRGDS